MLTRIEFTNFRGFRKLALEGLQRVNLIVGKNNSGKTSLLEGIAAFLNPAAAPEQFTRFRQLEQVMRQPLSQNAFTSWVIRDESAEKSALLSGTWSGMERSVVLAPMTSPADLVSAKVQQQAGRAPKVSANRQETGVRTCLVSAQHSAPERLVHSVGNAVRRRGGEELLETALHSVDPRIKKVRIDPIQNAPQVVQVVVDIGLSRLVPLSQVGQGTYRLIEIFSEVIGAEAHVAFVDELENGIHHTCLTEVWNGIAEAAQLFNVQVFATTHSHECIAAAHAAFLARSQYDFGIIQLFRESGEIQGRVLHQEHIAAAIAGDIDLRG